MTGTVAIRLFASAREAAGAARIDRPTGPEGVAIATVLRELAEQRPSLAPILQHARFARNGTYLRGRTGRLRPGDEFAVHPPYSGG
ncbi:MAG: MoaD/ThiS family protein [Thermoplasmata archaeon]|jgi:molybdopterin converting factor small subunit|nr:MoaD/ThiS family protein [Thermoplasmata archaeon]